MDDVFGDHPAKLALLLDRVGDSLRRLGYGYRTGQRIFTESSASSTLTLPPQHLLMPLCK